MQAGPNPPHSPRLRMHFQLAENEPICIADVADADMAKAAQWCVEQGIMEAKSADTFKPEGWTPKFNVIETWNKAFPKH